MKLKTMLGVGGLAAALCLCAGSVLAQDDNGGGPGGPPGGFGGPGGPGGPGGGGPGGPGGRGGFGGGFDPAQMQQRMMDNTRQSLDVTNDDDWAVIQPLVQKVMDARREVGNGGGMGMRGRGGPGGGFGGGPGGPGGPGGFGQQTSDEEQALRKAIEDNLPAPQIKDALSKYRAFRKDKQSKLEIAQNNLKGVLSTKQEGIAVLMGLLP